MNRLQKFLAKNVLGVDANMRAAAQPDPDFLRENRSARITLPKSPGEIRRKVRELQRTTPIVNAVLRSLSASIIGQGIVPQFAVTDTSGNALVDVNKRLSDLWHKWSERPEVTNTYSDAKAQIKIFEQSRRDGELFVVHRVGLNGEAVPYQYQIFDADACQGGLASPEYRDGIKVNEWGAPVEYRFHVNDTEFVEAAENVSHLAVRQSVNDLRGTSAFEACLNHIEDLRVLDRSEREAAKISSAFVAYIKRGDPSSYEPTPEGSQRKIDIEPGTLLDKLMAGEDISTLESSRPHANKLAYRDEIIRGIAGATGSSFSSIAKKYDGNYSSQRQELVEQSVLNRDFWTDYMNVFERRKFYFWMKSVEMFRLVELPRNVDHDSLYRPVYTELQVPWIDPAKEAQYRKIMVKSGLLSRQSVARSMGVDWNEIMREIQEETDSGLFPPINQMDMSERDSEIDDEEDD